jgi:dCMP deaminase
MTDEQSPTMSDAQDSSEPSQGESAVPRVDPARFLPRVRQVQWDHYYMQVALTVRTRANCFGARVGAVLVLDNRIVSTGFNGTPAGFDNCLDGGCVRCRQRELADRGLAAQITEPELAKGPKQLDLCICVHAEANALISAARFGNRTERSTLYATHKPCFSCLKEAYQAGVERVVWLYDWDPSKSLSLRRQYVQLSEHLSRNNPRNFEQLFKQQELVEGTATELREPVLDDEIMSKEPGEPANGEETLQILASEPAETKRTRGATQKAAKSVRAPRGKSSGE